MNAGRLAVVGTLWLSLSLAGCALAPPRVGEPPPHSKDPQAEREYQQILERHTSIQEIYALFDTRLFVGATYQSWEFREARVQRLVRFRAEPNEVLQQRLAQERAESDQFHEFFMAVHLNNRKYDEFDRRDSIWRLALVTPEGESPAVLVRRVGRADLNMRAMYPYADEFWVGYQVRFAKTVAIGPGTHFVLRLASTLGKTELTFRP